MPCDTSESSSSSWQESSLSNSCSESQSSNCSNCDSSSSSVCSASSNSDSCSNQCDSSSTHSSCDTDSKSSGSDSSSCLSCDFKSSESGSRDVSCSSASSCNPSGSCDASCSSASSCDVSCSSASSCDNSSASSCDVSCSSSRSCDTSDSSSECKLLSYDLATSDLTFIPTHKSLECGDFVGSRVVARGYVYSANTICNCNDRPFTGCGIMCDKPQYPRNVVGTYDLEYTIVNPEFNKALAALFSGGYCKFFEVSNALRGRVFANGQLTLSFSDSSDFFLPSVDTLVLSGRIPGGLKDDEWTMAILGGTGDYYKAYGEAYLTRLCATNGSRTRLGESWRVSFNTSVIARPGSE